MWLHGAGRVSFERDERFWIQRSPEFQTLSVWSSMPPLTIFVPSGENWTEEMEPNMPLVCAFCFSLIKVRDSVSEGKGISQEETAWHLRKVSTCIPNFEGLVVGTGNDRLSVGGEGHREDRIAVGIFLLRHELQSGCKGAGRVSFERDERFRTQRSPEFQTLSVSGYTMRGCGELT